MADDPHSPDSPGASSSQGRRPRPHRRGFRPEDGVVRHVPAYQASDESESLAMLAAAAHATRETRMVEPTSGAAKTLFSSPGGLRQGMSSLPAAIAVVAIMVAAGFALHITMMPIIPFVAIGVICISNWDNLWARSVWYMTLIVYILWLASETISVWFPFFLALVFAYITSPIVDWLTKFVKNRVVAVLLFFTLLFGVIAMFNWFAYSEIAETVETLSQRISDSGASEASIKSNVQSIVDSVNESLGIETGTSMDISGELAENVDKALRSAQNFGGSSIDVVIGQTAQTIGYISAWIINILLFLVAAFYLLHDWPRLAGKVDGYFSPQRSRRLNDLSTSIGRILRQYIQGHFLVCILVGLIFGGALGVFGHPYALLLGILMGVLGFIPFIGPIMGGVLAALLTFTVDPNAAALQGSGHELGYYFLAVGVSYAIAQGLNDFVLYPNIAGRAVEVNPVLSLLVLFLIGHEFGVLGMFFAVPLVAILRAVISWMHEEHVPGFEWLKLFRPYEDRERSIRLRREDIEDRVRSRRAATKGGESASS